MEFSVLATSFNDENNIKRFLDNFERQSLRPDYVIIVDGGSTDNTKEMIESDHNGYHFKVLSYFDIGRLNIAQGYNEAIRRCPTSWMIMAGIGNDYSENFCEELIKTQRSTSADVIYTPIIGNAPNAFSAIFNVVFVGGKRGKKYSGASNRGALISRYTYEKVGLFYEKFVYAGEDTEFFDRVKKYNIKMICCDKACVYWDTPTSFMEYIKKSKVNAIADMQIYSRMSIAKHISIRAAMIIVMALSAFIDWKITIAIFVVLSGLIIFKHKSLNFWAFLLRLHFIFLPDYYYLKFWRYTKMQYHFDETQVPELKGE